MTCFQPQLNKTIRFNGAGSDTTRPLILTASRSISQVFVYPSPVATLELIVGPRPNQPLQFLIVDQYVLSSRLLDLIVAGERPQGRMTDYAGTDHVCVDNVMSLCSRHMHSEKNGLFATEKLNIGRF